MPWSPSDLYDAYKPEQSIYEAAADAYSRSLRSMMDSARLPECTVKARAKDAVELFKKQRKKAYPDPWNECPDLVGARIVAPNLSSVSEVLDTLQTSGTFSEVKIEDQRRGADPDAIEYRGLHVHVVDDSLRNSRGDRIRCEVQIRTIAEDAWSVTNHRYVYKKPIELPTDVKRAFNRLLVLIELFDLELEKGVQLVSQLDSYRCFELSRHLEAVWTTFGVKPGDFESTFETVEEIVDAGLGTPDDLVRRVDDYVERHALDVCRVLETIGPDTPAFDIRSHWIVTQSEALLFMALLEEDQYRLNTLLAGSDLHSRVEPLAVELGKAGFLVG